MNPEANKRVDTNRCQALPRDARRRFESASLALPLLPATVAHPSRSRSSVIRRSYQSLVFAILVGCAKQQPDPASLIVIPGQGIPKIAEVGMTLSEIQSTAGDMTVRPYPESGLPWQKNSIGDGRRLPWEKPLHLTAASPSLGLVVSEDNRKTPVQTLMFFSDPSPFRVDSNAWFTGQISGGISFADRRRVSRAEIVAVFGEPSEHRTDFGKEVYQLMQEGRNASAKSSSGNGVENLFYPTNGISFCLQQDQVISFAIRQKVRVLEVRK